MSKYRAVLDISKLGRRYRAWCGCTNRIRFDLVGIVELVGYDLPYQCELWEVEETSIEVAADRLTSLIGGYPVTLYQIGPAGHPDIVWPRTSRCDYGHD